MCLDSDKKILHLCSTHVIAMSSLKSQERYHQLVFLEVCFSVIPIRWLLTVDSEMASFLFRSLGEDLLVFF